MAFVITPPKPAAAGPAEKPRDTTAVTMALCALMITQAAVALHGARPGLARDVRYFHSAFVRRDMPAAAACRVHMDVDDIQLDAEDRMGKTLQSLSNSLSTIRTGRASAAMLDKIVVEYYGAPTPLNQLASISTPTAQQLVVEPYDKAALKDVERALIDAELGMAPNNDGSVLRLNVPDLTEERRKEFAKQAKAFGEESKVALRNIRRDAIDSIKKLEKAEDSSLSKDGVADAQSDVDEAVKKFTKKVDDAVGAKEKEIMKV